MKTVLITGASSGIGKELAFVFAKNGFKLILVARRKDKLDEIKEVVFAQYQTETYTISMDLSLLGSAQMLYEDVVKQGHAIDVLINNAGFGINKAFLESDPELEEQMLVLNIITLTKLSRLFGKDMVSNAKGHIINISSIAAFQAVPTFAAYAASKAYVLSFSEALEYEFKNHGIQVTTICPGATQSEFAAVSNANEKMFAHAPTSIDLAEFTYEAYKNKKGTVINGVKGNLMTFSLRFSPRKVATKVAALMMK